MCDFTHSTSGSYKMGTRIRSPWRGGNRSSKVVNLTLSRTRGRWVQSPDPKL